MIEMLIVIMYISIVAAIVLPRVTGVARRASEANLKATLREVRTAVASYQAETGLYPVRLVDITATSAPDTGLTPGGIEVGIMTTDFHGPYLTAPGGGLPVDRSTGLRTWDYSTAAPTVGRVRSTGTGVDLDNVSYSTY